MRLTIIALSMLPFAAVAQEATDTAPTQNCPVGMVWDGAAQNCAIAANDTSPFDSLPGHVGCKGDVPRQVMS